MTGLTWQQRAIGAYETFKEQQAARAAESHSRALHRIGTRLAQLDVPADAPFVPLPDGQGGVRVRIQLGWPTADDDPGRPEVWVGCGRGPRPDRLYLLASVADADGDGWTNRLGDAGELNSEIDLGRALIDGGHHPAPAPVLSPGDMLLQVMQGIARDVVADELEGRLGR